MEKFGKWRDTFTGIHPFVPPSQPKRSPIAKIGLFLLSLPLILIRFPLLLIFAPVLVIRSILVSILQYIPIIGRAIIRIIDVIICGSLLLTLGFFRINTGSHRPKSGQLWVCRYTSYVDVIALNYLCSPTYVIPAAHNGWRQIGFLRCLLRSFNPNALLPVGTTQRLEEFQKLKTPVIVFAEVIIR